MYLEHFNLKELPFSLTPNVDFFCQLPGHKAALNTVLLSLRNGEGFIKVVGEVGAGKTLLCRLLLENLKNDFVTAYMPNPDLSPMGLRKALYQELKVEGEIPSSQHGLLEAITNHLITLHESGQRVVLLIDEAQAMSNECLEAVRLLTNLETKTTKLLQVVLFGQPELDVKLKQSNLRQLKQRITFSYYLPPLSRDQLNAYVNHRLAIAGHTTGTLFTKRALVTLFQKTLGIPRLINIICHKAMMVAYGLGYQQIDHRAVDLAAKDTESISKTFSYFQISLISLLCIAGILASIKLYTVFGINFKF